MKSQMIFPQTEKLLIQNFHSQSCQWALITKLNSEILKLGFWEKCKNQEFCAVSTFFIIIHQHHYHKDHQPPSLKSVKAKFRDFSISVIAISQMVSPPESAKTIF